MLPLLTGKLKTAHSRTNNSSPRQARERISNHDSRAGEMLQDESNSISHQEETEEQEQAEKEGQVQQETQLPGFSKVLA